MGDDRAAFPHRCLGSTEPWISALVCCETRVVASRAGILRAYRKRGERSHSPAWDGLGGKRTTSSLIAAIGRSFENSSESFFAEYKYRTGARVAVPLSQPGRTSATCYVRFTSVRNIQALRTNVRLGSNGRARSLLPEHPHLAQPSHSANDSNLIHRSRWSCPAIGLSPPKAGARSCPMNGERSPRSGATMHGRPCKRCVASLIGGVVTASCGSLFDSPKAS